MIKQLCVRCLQESEGEKSSTLLSFKAAIKMPPQLIFGTACFGMDGSSFQDADSVTEVLNCLQSLGVSHLDVAARYPPNNPGRAEQLVGEASELSHDFAIDTKVVFTTGDGGGHLTPENIENSLSTSLERMKLDNVDILYAHRSDPSTPLDEQARGFDAQVKAGRCKKVCDASTISR